MNNTQDFSDPAIVSRAITRLQFGRVLKTFIPVLIYVGVMVLVFLSFPDYDAQNPDFSSPVFVVAVGGIVVVLISMLIIYLRSGIISSAVATPAPTEQIKSAIMNYFSTQGTENIFVVSNEGDQLDVTFNAGIKYNQIINIGSENLRIKSHVSFDDTNKLVRIRTVTIDASANIGIGGISAKSSYNQGTTFNLSYVPSFVIENGSPKIQIEKLVGNSMDIIVPVAQLALTNGWNIKIS